MFSSDPAPEIYLPVAHKSEAPGAVPEGLAARTTGRLRGSCPEVQIRQFVSTGLHSQGFRLLKAGNGCFEGSAGGYGIFDKFVDFIRTESLPPSVRCRDGLLIKGVGLWKIDD